LEYKKITEDEELKHVKHVKHLKHLKHLMPLMHLINRKSVEERGLLDLKCRIIVRIANSVSRAEEVMKDEEMMYMEHKKLTEDEEPYIWNIRKLLKIKN
jgi:hypothetical protein